MCRKLGAFGLLQQPGFRKKQRIDPLLSLSLLWRFKVALCFAKLGVFDLIRD